MTNSNPIEPVVFASSMLLIPAAISAAILVAFVFFGASCLWLLLLVYITMTLVMWVHKAHEMMEEVW